ncbi:hypothetical protein K438DRAFT_2113734 [Mycena galopus ATCC 62051]|nr:hypothetical protein K438DRAFT_2113734 [Mycena galopus ATCC 62051]
MVLNAKKKKPSTSNATHTAVASPNKYDIAMGDEPEYHNVGDWQDIDSDEETAFSRPPPGEEGTTHSHAGKEDIFHQIYDQCIPGPINVSYGRHDSRKRTFRIQKTVDAWRRIMADLVDAYLALKMNGPANSDSNPEAWRIQVVGLDELGAHKFIHTGSTVNATLIHHGYLGASPEKVNRAFPLRMFEIYRQIHRVCPRFTLDALGKTLTNLHQGPRLKNLAEQLSTTYDAYLEMLRQVDARVDAALKRDPKWHSDNLVDSTFHAGTVRPDDRASMSFRWLSPEYVDAFKDEVMISRKVSTNRPEPQTESVPSIPEVQPVSEVPDSDTDGNNDVAWLNELELGADAEQLKATIDTCVERWKAAGPEGRKKMFALFAISGIFVSVCRHGHVLVMCDMIRSGELMKYPLFIVQALLDKYGADIGLGYDIILGTKVTGLRLRGVVPAFHGHAHNRACQIGWHPLYVDGVGLEDFEECMRYQNYRQALEKITFNRSQLTTLEAELGTSADDYESFHQAEVQFFQDLHSEPQQLKEAAEYIDLLLKMLQAQNESDEAKRDFQQLDHHIINDGYTRTEIARVKTRYRTTWDKYIAIQETTRRYEEEHNIETQWEPGSREWTDALALLTERNYREALTEVERLVVARLLELTKLGMSGVGYKLRDKISTALRTRAKAIQRALSVCNAAAAALNPPREQLTWAEVIDMTSLAEFDLLRQTRRDIRREPWTRPANREAMVLYFGLKRAKEEIRHLNVEIRRLITFLFDEHVDFYHAIAAHLILDPSLATELSMRYLHASRISASICRQLVKTSKLVGFSGNLFPGLRVGRDSSLSDGVPSPHWLGSVLGIGAVEVGYEEPDEQEPASDGDSNDDFVVRELEVDEEGIGQLMTHLSVYDDN